MPNINPERTLKCRFCDFVVMFKAKRAGALHFEKLSTHIYVKHHDKAEAMGLAHTEAREESNALMGLAVPARRREVRPFNRHKQDVV